MNKTRNATLDVARGFTVFIMPAVHSLLYYGNEKSRGSRLAKILAMLAEGPGAQLFMFLMGVSVTLSRKKSMPQIFRRGGLLFLQGIALNVLRLVIPYKLGLIPKLFLNDIGIKAGDKKTWKLLLTGDILQCAALSYLIAASVHQRDSYIRRSLATAALVTFVSPELWDKGSCHPAVNYIMKLWTGKPPETFFPLLPWLVYPLAGVVWGHYLKALQAKQLYAYTAFAGVLLYASGKLLSIYEPANQKNNFYRLGPGGTLQHLGVVLIWLCLCRKATEKLKRSRFLRLLMWLSPRITPVYFIQWIVVLWLLPLFGYRRSRLLRAMLAMMVNTILTFKIAKLKKPLSWKRLTSPKHAASFD